MMIKLHEYAENPSLYAKKLVVLVAHTADHVADVWNSWGNEIPSQQACHFGMRIMYIMLASRAIAQSMSSLSITRNLSNNKSQFLLTKTCSVPACSVDSSDLPFPPIFCLPIGMSLLYSMLLYEKGLGGGYMAFAFVLSNWFWHSCSWLSSMDLSWWPSKFMRNHCNALAQIRHLLCRSRHIAIIIGDIHLGHHVYSDLEIYLTWYCGGKSIWLSQADHGDHGEHFNHSWPSYRRISENLTIIRMTRLWAEGDIHNGKKWKRHHW